MTDAGRELAAASKDIFDRLERVEDRLIALRALEQGRLRVAASSAAKDFTTRLLSRFCERHPRIEVSLNIDNWRGLRRRIRENEDDLYVLLTLPEEPEMLAYPVRPHRIDLYAHAGHALVRKRNIHPAQLAVEPFILREPGSATRRIAEELCSQWGIVPRVRMELSSNEAIQQAVRDGLGLAFLSDDVVRGTDSEALQCLDVPDLPVIQQWLIAHIASRPLPQIGAAFLQYVRAHAFNEAHEDMEQVSPRAAA
jgi:LysR family transcriptional regulator, low CO2-responsive transcriptional regulator